MQKAVRTTVLCTLAVLVAACSGGGTTDDPIAAPLSADHVSIMVGEDI